MANSEKIEQYYGRWGRIDPLDYVWFWNIILPPVEGVVKSENPVWNVFLKPDHDYRHNKVNTFAQAMNSCRMIFHTGHEDSSPLCLYGRTGYESHEKDSVQVVTRLLFGAVMQQGVRIEDAFKGREEVVKMIEDSLTGQGFNSYFKDSEKEKWGAESLVQVAEKHKSYLETLSKDKKIVDGVGVFGLEVGQEFFHPDEIPIYMNKDELKVYPLIGVVG